MAKFWNDYHVAASVEEALDLLARYHGRARVIAGGTDLLLDLQNAYDTGERPHFDALIDVTAIRDATSLREEDGCIVIGCGVTHAAIVASRLVQTHATALAEACAVVGGPQVRNVATLAGNIAHALPAADGLVALLVLGAEAEVANGEGGNVRRTWVPLAELYRGPGESAVDATRELISALRLRATGEHEGSAFARVMRPQGVALPILGMGARVRLQGQFIEDIAISAGPVAPAPFRAREAEIFMRGKEPNEETLAQAVRLILSQVSPRTSPHRATREYRFELLPWLARQVVTRAVERARA